MRIGNAIVATGILLLAALSGIASAGAQATDVRFILDFLLQGQQSPFVLGRERGYYAAQKVNLAAFDPGRGGADSIRSSSMPGIQARSCSPFSWYTTRHHSA